MFRRSLGFLCAAVLVFGACAETEEAPPAPASTPCPAAEPSGPPKLAILAPDKTAKVAAGESIQLCLDVGGAVLQGPGKKQGKPGPRAYRLTLQINKTPPTVMTGTVAALIATPGEGDRMTVTVRLKPLRAGGETLKDSVSLTVKDR